VSTIDALSLPFATWQEGLLALATALQDSDHEKIIVSRLEVTAAQIGIGPLEVCALALLVPSRARFEPVAWPESHPDAIRLAAMVDADGKLTQTLSSIVDGLDRRRRSREEKVFSAFLATDRRRLLNDTIIGFAAAELSDVSQRLGEADPFSRLAGRLSLWFKQSHDYSRYGVALAEDGKAVTDLVRRATVKLDSNTDGRLKRLIEIWAGDVDIDMSVGSIEKIVSLVPFFEGSDNDHLDAVLAMEILGALANDLENLDIDTGKFISEVFRRFPKGLDDGRPTTSDLRTWLNGQSHGENRFRLVYDPCVFWSNVHADNADVLEPLLGTTLEQMKQGGHAVFPTGLLPMYGSLFKPESKMIDRLAREAPEAADLIRLLGADGDYNDMDGPYPPQCYWVGNFNPDAITFPDAIANAVQRGDHALCDMLIGCWLLFCTLYLRVPLPDLVGLARCITALPVDYRSSTYSALGVLKREAIEDVTLRRDVEAILSWLPLVDTAPPEDFKANMRDQFSPRLWDATDREEKESLVRAEMFFVRIRRLHPFEREKEPLDMMILNWSRVAERFLRRALASLGGPGGDGKPLGQLIGMTKKVLERGNDSWSLEEKRWLRFMPAALNELDQLDFVNKKGGKHLDGIDLTWEHVVNVHTGIHWALRTLLDAASSAATNAKSD
jgi:hypothetical protein